MDLPSPDADPAAPTGGNRGSGPADPFVARRDYRTGELTEQLVASTWLEQLRRWYAEAVAGPEIIEANAMQVATVDSAGHPDVRTVLARGFDESGIVFFTNYSSAKGQQLAEQPYAAAVFSWLGLERQVRLRGPVHKVAREETARYFAGRPRESQIGAWASPQSQVIADRAELERLVTEASRRFGTAELEPPPYWGGYRIEVSEIEFWQGREFRLHDRIRFRRVAGDADGSARWVVERLAP